MSEEPADFITILSSDMIADIVQVYFDKDLYTKKKVKIIDLKPQGDGYAFSLVFVPKIIVTGITPKTGHWDSVQTVENSPVITFDDIRNSTDGRSLVLGKRDNKGRFVKDHE